jgi:hypothetical protein
LGSREDAKTRRVIQREIETLWQEGGIIRILDTSLKTPEKILVLLTLRGDQAPSELQRIIEYKRTGDFMKILKGLHDDRHLELTDDLVTISPRGIAEAERILETS